MTVIRRVTELTLEGFRAFPKKRIADVDGDIVLLSGPNGTGKSSVLDALGIMLNHHCFVGGLSKHVTRQREPLFAFDAERVRLEARVIVDGEDGPATQVRMSISAEDLAAMTTTWPDGTARTLDMDPALAGRLSTVIADRWFELFDETCGSAATLGTLLDPPPRALKALADGLPDRIAELESFLERMTRPRAVTPDPPPERTLLRLIGEVVAAVEPVLRHVPDVAGIASLPASAADLTQNLHAVARAWVEKEGGRADWRRLPGEFVHRFGLRLDAVERELRRRAPRDQEQTLRIESTLRELDAEQHSLQEQFPGLEHEIGWFSGVDGLPDLQQILDGLAAQVGTWRQAQVGASRLGRVLQELKWVDAQETRKLASELRFWLGPRLGAARRLRDIATERARREEALVHARRSRELDEFVAAKQHLERLMPLLRTAWEHDQERLARERSHATRSQAADLLRTTLAELRTFYAALVDISRPSAELNHRLEELARQVMRRYCTAGPLDLTLTPNDDDARGRLIDTADGRVLEALSTGQRLQAGVSLLLASNHLATPWLPHRVILVDDFGAGYDLANLTREALLWRQVAFHDSSDHRRQVFLATHDHERTLKLLDLLQPPPGRTVKLVAFQGWSAQDGPELEPRDIACAAALRDGNDWSPAVRDFRASLEGIWPIVND